MSNPLIYSTVILPIDSTAAAPAIQIGGSPSNSSGTGIYGNETSVSIAINGVQKALINSSGITGSISGTASLATSLAGGIGGTIPYQSAANVTAMLANGTAGQVLASQGTTVAPHWVTPTPVPSILAFTSAASAGGTPTEVLTVTGLLATDTILAVSQSVPGSNNLPLLGFNTPATSALTAVWSADPGAGAIIVVSVKR